MHIRKAEMRDIPALRDIYNYEVIHGTATFDIEEKSMEERTEWFYAHNRDNHPLIVCERNGEAIGYASLSSYRTKAAYQHTVELSIYVAVAHRRQGVATALMDAILTMAREDDRIHTVVSVITDGNQASIGLHEKFGFSYSGTLHEVGIKFGRCLDIYNYELRV